MSNTKQTHGAVQDAEEQPSAIEAAAAGLDSAQGPASFTDFLKVVLHPRSVVQVPLLGSSITGGPTGFGGISAHPDISSQARHRVVISYRC